MGNTKSVVYVLLTFLLLVNVYEIKMSFGIANTMELIIKLACVLAIFILGYLNSKK